jgi:hypothetical protein
VGGGTALEDFPFDITDVASLLNLHIRRRQSNSIYTDCPICGDSRGKMNINLEKNIFRCNYCGESGGMLALYGKTHGIGSSDAYREIRDALQTGNRPRGEVIKAVEKQPSIQNSELAGIDEINRTLSLLFDMLTLSEPHRKNLQNRGLTNEQINRLGYKSTPPAYSCLRLTGRLIQQGCAVKGVPGFYLDGGGRWTVKFHTRTAGILIPVRGIDGLIRGAQIRLDIPIKDENDKDKEGAKYLWLSSSNKHMGVTSGSPVHFTGDPFARTVYVTEGALKGDIAHCLMNRSFACVAGANNLGRLDPVFSVLAHNGTELIVDAHDMDKYRNETVAKGASQIYVMAHKYNMESRRLTWNPNYKGIDDWQNALKNKSMKKEECNLNFKEHFLLGVCTIDDIAFYIVEWHKNSATEQSLPDYLGLSGQEYQEFLSSGIHELESLLLAQQKKQKFRIYQLEFTNESQTKAFAFEGIKALYKAGYEQPPAAEYRLIHDSEFKCRADLPDKGILEHIFIRYNDDLPEEYHGRSVSPSDVIELYDDEKRRYFYCDSAGFTKVEFSPALTLPMKVQAQ